MAYAVLFGAYVRAWRWHMQMSRWKAIFLALAICLVVSAGDEGRQAFYASRTGCPQDVALDMSGAFTAAIAFFPFLRHENQRESANLTSSTRPDSQKMLIAFFMPEIDSYLLVNFISRSFQTSLENT